MGLEADRREWAHSGYSVPVKRELRRNGTGAVACSRLYLSALLPLSVLVPGTESYPFPSTTIHYCAVSSFLFFLLFQIWHIMKKAQRYSHGGKRQWILSYLIWSYQVISTFLISVLFLGGINHWNRGEAWGGSGVFEKKKFCLVYRTDRDHYLIRDLFRVFMGKRDFGILVTLHAARI